MVKCKDCGCLYQKSHGKDDHYYCISKNVRIRDLEKNTLCLYYFSLPDFFKLASKTSIHQQ